MSYNAIEKNQQRAMECENASADALQVSFIKFKFKPDYFNAANYLMEAAQCYTSARMIAEAKAAHERCAELRLKDHDHASAARAYETAGNFDKAADCYIICSGIDQAARSILKQANSSTDPAVQLACYEKAIDIYSKDDSKDVMASDVYKQYITKLVAAKDFDKYLKVSPRYAELLIRLEQWPFVHKEILGQVIVNLARNEIVGAERVIEGPNINVEGFVHSAEFAAADDLLTAFRENDAEKLKNIVSRATVTYLNTEIVRLAKSLKVLSVAPVVAADGTTQPPKQDAVDELLM